MANGPSYKKQGSSKPSWSPTDWSQWSVPQTRNFNNLQFSDQQKMLRMMESQGKQNTSMPDRMMTTDLQKAWADKGYLDRGGGVFELDPNKKKETSWWDTIGDAMGSDGFLGGVKGWLDLGVKGMEAYTGLQQVGLAREQNELGRDAFSFQKAAWNKDYDARKIAYNTNARDVNAWKAAQTPGGYTMSELVV